ncbi:TetR/AcrR family transcriptional regulator [Rhodococcus sp. NPDC003382]|uniref:TetR/AcrR family transcriptional regulator n=1 Tax=unclassified Rhodococcus (in: high G+C Gram-positive bacteria) TaxID=192944 RepID=UPI0018CEF1AA|nr:MULTISPECIES: TetR/AcrR family transcriptional regulator [unclassified Rhodococcus (in: high G+C Gram-positive bacteria)]MBH0122371.1 TetR/AcrR family transcriptional regulator [Rhodococcus sp. CX]MCK8670289.1 TetR/AcrR family transcriptional regulator [Rhodococcus sp. HM1]
MNTIPLPRADDEHTAERCDAARNRRLLLDAATLLVSERGVDAVTMEAVAARAGVGKGTVFRRFGSRGGLMQALLDHTEREFQEAFMTGPPPLGPGADPVDRLIAFGRARIALVEVQGELLRAAEASSSNRFDAPARAVTRTHIETLLRAADVGGDVPLLAHSLCASLEATLVLHQWRNLGYSLDRLSDNWSDLVRRVAASPDSDDPDRTVTA